MIVFLSNGHDWFLSDCYTQYTVVILAGLPGFYYISHAEQRARTSLFVRAVPKVALFKDL